MTTQAQRAVERCTPSSDLHSQRHADDRHGRTRRLRRRTPADWRAHGPRFRHGLPGLQSLQVDYSQSSRLSAGYGGYPHDELVEGPAASTRRDSITQETLRDINVLAAWRTVVRRDAEVKVLFGAGARHTRRTDCTAFAGPRRADPDVSGDHSRTEVRVLAAADIRRAFTAPEAVDAMRSALGELSGGTATIPVRGP